MVARGLVNWVLGVGIDAPVGGEAVVSLPGTRNVAVSVTCGLVTEDCINRVNVHTLNRVLLTAFLRSKIL